MFFLSFFVRCVFGAFYCFVGVLSFFSTFMLFDFIISYLFLVLLLSVMFSTFSLAGRCFSHPMVQRQRHKANVQVRCVFYCQPITTRRQLDMKKKVLFS